MSGDFGNKELTYQKLTPGRRERDHTPRERGAKSQEKNPIGIEEAGSPPLGAACRGQAVARERWGSTRLEQVRPAAARKLQGPRVSPPPRALSPVREPRAALPPLTCVPPRCRPWRTSSEGHSSTPPGLAPWRCCGITSSE